MSVTKLSGILITYRYNYIGILDKVNFIQP